MKILDKSGLEHYSQKLSKTNKVVSLKCTNAHSYDTANSIIEPMITVIVQNINKLYGVNNATFILKDNNNDDRGVASYVGNGGSTRIVSVGYIDMYVFDSGNEYAQAKYMINKGIIKKMS